jgi:hypothetical protein
VIPLVRRAEDREVAWNRREAEQVNEVERALVSRDRSVLDVVSDIEQLTHRRGVAARHTALDPVVDAHLVQRDASRGGQFVQGWIGSCVHVLLDVVPHRVEVGARLGCRVVLAEEVVGFGRVVRLDAKQVDPRDVEPIGQPEDGLVA